MPHEEKIESLYPESYRRLYPHVQDVVDTLDEATILNMSQADIGRLAGQAVTQSGVTSKQQVPYGGGVLGDLAQVLVLRELFDRHDWRRAPFFFPFFPYGRFRRRRRRGRFGRY